MNNSSRLHLVMALTGLFLAACGGPEDDGSEVAGDDTSNTGVTFEPGENGGTTDPGSDPADDSTTSVVDETGEEPSDTSGSPDPIGPSDTGAPADPPPVATAASETCEDALDLATVQDSSLLDGFDFVLTGTFGQTDDYNPLSSAGLPPGCALVYDANGHDVVVRVTLEPGQILRTRYAVDPGKQPGALYVLDSCPDATWPDHDASGACGDNEYVSQGFCAVGDCVPLQLDVTHPVVLDGEATTTATYWLVLDSIGQEAEGWQLDWRVEDPAE